MWIVRVVNSWSIFYVCVCMCMKYIKNIRHASMCHVSLYDFLLLFLNDKKNACVKSISPLSCLPLLNRRKCVQKIYRFSFFFVKYCRRKKTNLRKPKVCMYKHTHTSHKSFSYFLDVQHSHRVFFRDSLLAELFYMCIIQFYRKICISNKST